MANSCNPPLERNMSRSSGITNRNEVAHAELVAIKISLPDLKLPTRQWD